MFNKINAVVLFVDDFAKTLEFYKDKLELPVVQQEEKFAAFKMFEQNFAIQELAQSADMVGLTPADFEPQTGKSDRVMLCAYVDNVDSIYDALKAKGVAFTKGPVDQYWGIRAIYFCDPEGNVWEIAQPLNNE